MPNKPVQPQIIITIGERIEVKFENFVSINAVMLDRCLTELMKQYSTFRTTVVSKDRQKEKISVKA